MARYIEKEPLCAWLENMGVSDFIIRKIESEANFPTADVVPKSEPDRLVDKWIGSGELIPDEKTLRLIEALRDEAKRYERYYFNHEYDKLIAEAKAEVAREIFEEISVIFSEYYGKASEPTDPLLEPLHLAKRFVINEMWAELAELKKKYTG